MILRWNNTSYYYWDTGVVHEFWTEKNDSSAKQKSPKQPAVGSKWQMQSQCFLFDLMELLLVFEGNSFTLNFSQTL